MLQDQTFFAVIHLRRGGKPVTAGELAAALSIAGMTVAHASEDVHDLLPYDEMISWRAAQPAKAA